MCKEINAFNRLGVMLDCSRMAVMNLPTLKKWIDIMADLGYNTLMLYTEDTYEVDNQPYFGYLRGRYSKEELREIDSYAFEKGIELIPAIQTLAHLNNIFRWRPYRQITTAMIFCWQAMKRPMRLLRICLPPSKRPCVPVLLISAWTRPIC